MQSQVHARIFGILCLIAVVACTRSPLAPNVRKTPFGLVHEDCIIEVRSGSTVADILTGIRISHANGTIEERPPCTAFPRAIPPEHKREQSSSGRSLKQSSWNGWYEHFWFGMTYLSTTDCTAFNATWTVPQPPANVQPDAGSPWQQQPTESWWTGIQSDSGKGGQAVIQPVIELNGLDPTIFDASSWNCCPQGFTVHSSPIPASPGAQVVGTMTQVSPWADQYMYTITTTVDGQSTTLTADLTQLSGWTPTMVQVKYEAYYVTDCAQLTTSNTKFTDMVISFDNTVTPNVPWTPSFIVSTGETPAPICGGTSTTDDYGNVAIGFDA